MNDYINDYQTLGVRPDCSLHTLKAARRRLVRSWHPDRFADDSPEKRLAEERIKEINAAFDRLINYHSTYGALPRPGMAAAVAPQATAQAGAPEAQAAAADIPTAGSEPPAATASRLRKPVLWVLVLAGIGLLVDNVRPLLDHSDEPVRSVPSAAPRLPPIAPAQRRFGVGSSEAEVYAAQGAPTATERGVWYYGGSRVYFAAGRVTGWQDHPSNPLNTHPHSEPRSAPPFFTIGSTKDDVRAVEGAPLLETDTVWDYGLAKVYFRNGYVVGWETSSMRPLKARK